MKRAPLVLATAAAALVLTGCSGSGSAGSTTVTGSVAASGVPTTVPSVSVDTSGLAASASSLAASASGVAGQLQAVKDCLQKANLPTPTSTDPSAFAQEALTLVKDQKTRDALKACGINLPGM